MKEISRKCILFFLFVKLRFKTKISAIVNIAGYAGSIKKMLLKSGTGLFLWIIIS